MSKTTVKKTAAKKQPSTETLSASALTKAFSRRRTFTTADVMSKFKCHKAKAAAPLAVLSGSGALTKLSIDKNGYSVWGWVRQG